MSTFVSDDNQQEAIMIHASYRFGDGGGGC
ncbi:hypothetical protein QE360_002048 [Sphingomonas sp. SORGH_AS789]|nr:hypothetical protein [Sphingomonas sp. SORGH_AS_0789]MDR6151247.1 hypothetical protein [Sphingomonas sp. SORGH_AS_0742]